MRLGPNVYEQTISHKQCVTYTTLGGAGGKPGTHTIPGGGASWSLGPIPYVGEEGPWSLEAALIYREAPL